MKHTFFIYNFKIEITIIKLKVIIKDKFFNQFQLSYLFKLSLRTFTKFYRFEILFLKISKISYQF